MPFKSPESRHRCEGEYRNAHGSSPCRLLASVLADNGKWYCGHHKRQADQVLSNDARIRIRELALGGLAAATRGGVLDALERIAILCGVPEGRLPERLP